jgi:vacuolar-type H+-ATPase subunit D/Vma8
MVSGLEDQVVRIRTLLEEREREDPVRLKRLVDRSARTGR